MNRFQRAWRELTTTKTESKRNVLTSGSSLFSGWGAWNPVDNADRDLARTVYGATLAYLYAPPVRPAIEVIGSNAASVPLLVVDADGNVIARSDENVNNSPVLKAFERSWVFHKQSLVSMWVKSHLLYGMSFLEKRGQMYTGTDLKWLNPNMMQIEAPRGIIESYRYTGQDRYVSFAPGEIVYSKAFNPADDIYGYSATMNIMAEVNASIHFDKFKAAYYNNAGQPGFMFVPESATVGESELRRLRDFWHYKLRGVENFFKLVVSPIKGELKSFDPIDISKPVEMDKDTERRILKGYGVPPEMIGDTEGNPYQFSPEKKNAFMQTVVRPVLKSAVIDAMNYEGFAWLDPIGYEKGYRLRADFSEYDTISESRLKEEENARLNFLNGGLSYNEYRQSIGYDPLPEARNFYAVPSSVTIVSANEIGNPAAMLPSSALPPPAPVASREAPPQTTFSSVTYNGITVQASPVQPSTREDKKFMRYVRYDGSERLVHWGQPGEQMERDNPEARENFKKRHKCDQEKDPFAPGFWACWAWQPDAEVRSTPMITLSDLRSVAAEYNITLAETLDYFEEFERVH